MIPKLKAEDFCSGRLDDGDKHCFLGHLVRYDVGFKRFFRAFCYDKFNDNSIAKVNDYYLRSNEQRSKFWNEAAEAFNSRTLKVDYDK